MASLEELAKNAIPPTPEETKQTGPVIYAPTKGIPEMKEVDASSLGAPAPPPPPTIMQKKFADLDRAIERDKKHMMENVIKPALEAYEANQVLGAGGVESYFDKDIEGDSNSQWGIPKNLQNPSIDIPDDVVEKIKAPNTKEESSNNDDSDLDFLNDNSIYSQEGNPTMNENQAYAGTPIVPTPTSAAPTHIVGATITIPEEIAHKQFKTTTTPAIVHTEDIDKGDSPLISEMAPEAIPTPIPNMAANKIDYDLSDKYIDEAFAENEDSDDVTESERGVSDEDMEEIRNVVRSIRRVDNVVDLRSYKISTKPVNPGNVLATISKIPVPTAKWVNPCGGNSYIISALKGTEIDVLAGRRAGQTEVMRNEEIVKLFYDHIVSPKPASWQAWAKTVLYDDFSHLYFDEYVACFSKANFAPFECPNGHNFMK